MKMKIMKNIFIGFSLTLLLNSCNYLETEPKGTFPTSDFYKTEKEVQAGINGVYRALSNNSLYGANMQGIMGLSADLGYESYNRDRTTVGYNYVFSTDERIANYWKYLYIGISRANLLLENINKAPMDEVQRGNIKGEALFLRAYNYFMLVKQFQKVPLILESAKSAEPQYTQIAQSAPEVVYEQIIKDMEEAETLVVSAEGLYGGGRINKSAVNGILARVCLTMAGAPVNRKDMYEKAENYAKKVIGFGIHELNAVYENVFINYAQDKYDIKESIWELEYYGDNTVFYSAGMVGRNTGIASPAGSSIGFCQGFLRASGYLYQLYKSNDKRRDWCIGSFTYNSTTLVPQPVAGTEIWNRYCAKFRREKELSSSKQNNATPINFPMLRYSDVLLMYAEAHFNNMNANAGDHQFALECFNQVRRRGAGFPVKTANASVDYEYTNLQSFMQEVQDERARELAFELLRKDDLVRWGKYYTQMQFVKNTVPANYAEAVVYYNNTEAKGVVWPIPSYEMGVNRKLIQNAGW
ncbi:RagB/SusD family nutrient uptake outer membrane protein [Pedobacter sp. ASV1-7]|uniref:RagB/SusD family nutrient uptake outer membrane protein n=1 Tax=Pedobacter sp. ASV1-7 TaxID=3145237 RepID=UPI0032E91AAB